MDPPKAEEQPIENIDEEEEQESEEEEVSGKNKTLLNERMLAAVKKNDFEEVEKCLKKKADIWFEGTSIKYLRNQLQEKMERHHLGQLFRPHQNGQAID